MSSLLTHLAPGAPALLPAGMAQLEALHKPWHTWHQVWQLHVLPGTALHGTCWPGTAREEQGCRPWRAVRPSRSSSSSTHLSACAGEGFGFWPRCRSCLGDESLPVAFLSREPGDSTRTFLHVPAWHQGTGHPACTDCPHHAKNNARSSSSSWKSLTVCPLHLWGSRDPRQGCAPQSPVHITFHQPFLTLQLLQ